MSFGDRVGAARYVGSTLPLVGCNLRICYGEHIESWIRYNQNFALVHRIVASPLNSNRRDARLALEGNKRRRGVLERLERSRLDHDRSKINFQEILERLDCASKEDARDDFVSPRLEFLRSRRGVFLEAYAIVVDRKASPERKII